MLHKFAWICFQFSPVHNCQTPCLCAAKKTSKVERRKNLTVDPPLTHYKTVSEANSDSTEAAIKVPEDDPERSRAGTSASAEVSYDVEKVLGSNDHDAESQKELVAYSIKDKTKCTTKILLILHDFTFFFSLQLLVPS